MKFNVKNLTIYKLFFYFSLISSFTLGLIMYDTTTGLDWNQYSNTIKFFRGESDYVSDPQGALYFSILSKLIYFFRVEKQLSVSVLVQTFNFQLFLIGLAGLKALLENRNFDKSNIYLTFSILCYFPPIWYLRLTTKPEVFAFAIFPWVLCFLDLYLIKKKSIYLIPSIVSTTLIITSKASIGGMVLLCLLFYYLKELKNFKKINILFTGGIFATLLVIIENYRIMKIWFFEKFLIMPELGDSFSYLDWDNRSTLDFFINIDVRNLYENPFKYLHSDSFISITLLDTLSDYFGFFWNHQEINNLIAFNRIEFSENFLIQSFLPMYVSIIFTVCFYFFLVILVVIKINDWKYYTFPFFGLIILTINSLGFPSNNFNPATGDTFKVHYYSFLISFTFTFFVATANVFLNRYKIVSLLLIPIFLITMGFPKETSENYKNKFNERAQLIYYCNFSNSTEDLCMSEPEFLKNEIIFYESQENKNNSLMLINYLFLFFFISNITYLTIKKNYKKLTFL